MRRFLKAPILIILISVLLIFLIFIFVPQKFELKSPNGGEQWRAGLTYSITWKARKIGEIDLYLVKEGTKEKIRIGEKISAAKKKFDWKINPWQEPREDYKIYIVESKTEKILDYSKRQFTIIGPKFSDCYKAALADPYKQINLHLPADYPGIRRIFITNGTFNGNIGGLEKADQICQQEAKKMGLEGSWKALLGDENNPIRNRIENLEGIIVEAPGQLTVIGEYIPTDIWARFGDFISKSKVKPQVKSQAKQAYEILSEPFRVFLSRVNQNKSYQRCHRFLANNLEEFFTLLQTVPLQELQMMWGNDFVNKLRTGVWLGIFDSRESKECLDVPDLKYYSLTVTCGNWTLANDFLEGFLPNQPEEKQIISVKICYAPSGEKIMAGAVGGRSILLKGLNFSLKYGAPCKNALRLICIEQEEIPTW